jgi:metal-responsive CopG/Arc/MetJ family transcriptional regulator
MVKKHTGQSVSTWLPEGLLKRIDGVVDDPDAGFNSRSEILRDAVRQWLMQRERHVVEYRRKIHPDELEQQSGP